MLRANHMPLLQIGGGQYIAINNSSNSETSVRITIYGILVDDTDEFIGY